MRFVREQDSSAPLAQLSLEMWVTAQRRLKIAMLLWGGVYLFYLILYSTIWADIGVLAARLIGWSAVLFSGGSWLYLTREQRSATTLTRFGVTFEIVICLALGLTEYIGLGRHHYSLPPDTISWTCVIIIVFPHLVPTRVSVAALAAFSAASANAVAFWVAMVVNPADMPNASVIFALLLPPYLCALVAIIPARAMSRLGAEARRARQLGSYVLKDRLGKGGMGEVWRASHQILSRPAAVKLISPESLEQSGDAHTLFERFQREAHATANLRSPHTVEVYDFGVAADGTFYYVMELLGGFDLDKLVRTFGPMSPARMVHLLTQVCDSLDEAHAAELIHRDIKPANLFVTCCGPEPDFVKVLDFGLVKQTEPVGSIQLTAEVALLGTPAFVAPEAAVGAKQIDGRADLYALGCVAYWLLTGLQVFEDETPMGVLIKHVKEEPVSPSTVSELEIPVELDRLVMDCLAKNPDDRPATAADLREQLLAIPVEPWSRARAARWWQTHAPATFPEIS